MPEKEPLPTFHKVFMSISFAAFAGIGYMIWDDWDEIQERRAARDLHTEANSSGCSPKVIPRSLPFFGGIKVGPTRVIGCKAEDESVDPSDGIVLQPDP